jgi:drug/metabolite transporter (DMT)-like permease
MLLRLWNSKWFLLLSVVVLWGSSFALVRIAVATVPAVWVMAIRLAIAALALTATLYVARLRFPADLASWRAVAAIAVIGNVVPFLLIAWGLNYIPSSLSGILMAVMPLGVVVLAHFFLPDEPLSPVKFLGFLLGFVGVVVILGPERFLSLSFGGWEFLGQLAVIAAALCYSLQSIVSRRMKAKGALEMATATLLVAALIGLPMALIGAPGGLTGATGEALLALFVVGLFTTGLASVVYFQLIRTAGASFASLINYLIPVYAMAVGATFLDESIGVAELTGLALILAGIAVVQLVAAARSAKA